MQAGKSSNIQIHAVGMPTMAEILKTLEVCQKNPGRMVVLQWAAPEAQREYELSATIPVVRARVGASPLPISSVPELSLTYITSPGGAPTLVWNQTTADPKVIHHLVKRESGGPSTAFVGFDDDDATDKSSTPGRSGIADTSASTTGGFNSISGFSAGNGFNGGNGFSSGSNFNPGMTGSNQIGQSMGNTNNDLARISGVRQAPSANTYPNGLPIESNQPNAAISMKLEGNLGEIDLSNLLQSIAMCKMTGCMKVFNDDIAASLYMDKGTPTHAYAVGAKAITASGAEIEGSDALLEMLLMNDGVFQFNPQQQSIERTVPKPLQMYLLEGATLRDHHTTLGDRGITEDSVFARAHKKLEYAAFKSILAEGIPASMPVQKHFYQLSDGKISLGEMLRKQPLKKAEWVPALYNLLQCGLLQVSNDQNEDESTYLAPEKIKLSIEQAYQTLVNNETGLMPFSLFLHQVDQEFARYEMSSSPFSMAVYEVFLQSPEGALPLNTDETRLMTEGIKLVVNRYDHVASFMDGAFAILMPMQDAIAAAVTAQKILDVVKKMQFARATAGMSAKVMVGIAGVPDTATDMVSLLKTANEAKNFCRKTGANIYTHKNLSNSRI